MFVVGGKIPYRPRLAVRVTRSGSRAKAPLLAWRPVTPLMTLTKELGLSISYRQTLGLMIPSATTPISQLHQSPLHLRPFQGTGLPRG